MGGERYGDRLPEVEAVTIASPGWRETVLAAIDAEPLGGPPTYSTGLGERADGACPVPDCPCCHIDVIAVIDVNDSNRDSNRHAHQRPSAHRVSSL